MAAGAVSGTKIIVFISRLPVRQASEEAALPVEAQVITFSLISSARAVTTALALSLKEALGLRPSSLIYRLGTPHSAPSFSAR